MDRGTHHAVSFLPCVFVLNLPKTSPCAWCYVASKGCILTCRSCLKLVDLSPHTHKANETCYHQSPVPWTEVHTVTCHFCLVRFCQIFPKPAHPVGVVGPERHASWHTGHVPSLPIHCHTPKRHIKHANSNHQIHEQRCTLSCIILSSAFCQICPKPAYLMGTVGPERDAS